MNKKVTNSFTLLNSKVQKWVYEQGWESLKQIQEESINHIFASANDIIITASTAGGKTEAAFLPAISKILEESLDGFAILCISPLKALINDQTSRLESIAKFTGTNIYPWHGDIPATTKKKALKEPNNSILLITPESLEALFINKPSKLFGLFRNLKFIIIDELHSFIGRERGKQLQSLIFRLSEYCQNQPRKIALSATLGDISIAKEFLSKNPESITHIDGKGGRSLKIKVNIYDSISADRSITEDIFKKFRGSKNLIFANSRKDVELYTLNLSELCKNNHVPNEFFAHHGNLSKEVRQDAEGRLKSDNLPTTIIATSTLELGIDVGSVKQVGQINPPHSVSSLVQRLGRSGRKIDESSILRCYLKYKKINEKSDIYEQLHISLIQTIAVINLLLKKWYEPQENSALHLSTFIQQVLSFIAQKGGEKLDVIFKSLCKNGAFENIDKDTFVETMRCLKYKNLIFQNSENFVMLAKEGEKLVNDYEFYTAFTTTEEYKVVYNERVIGFIPITTILFPEMPIILAGKKWLINSIDYKTKIISVKRTDKKIPLSFDGSSIDLNDKIVEEMRKVYKSEDEYLYIDSTSSEILKEARYYYNFYNLDDVMFLPHEKDVMVFTWKGTKTNNTIALILKKEGFDYILDSFGFTVKQTSVYALKAILKSMMDKQYGSEELASIKLNNEFDKHDIFLNEALKAKNYASKFLDTENAYKTIREILI